MIEIQAIPAFETNYIWALSRDDQTWVVDPGQAAPVEHWLETRERTLAGILITHHHPDHVGGVAALLKERPGLPVVGWAKARIPWITEGRLDGDPIQILGLDLTIIEVPGHTLDHIAFFGQADGMPVLFCGDTLFSSGCGRLFEGSPAQMTESLARLRELPASTRIYCAHEYTLDNLRFAASVEPENAAIERRRQECQRLLAEGHPTLPVTLSAELDYNPFLRLGNRNVIDSVMRYSGLECDSDVAVFTQLRRWKDAF